MNTKKNSTPLGFSIGIGLLASSVIGPIIRFWQTGQFNLEFSILWTVGMLGLGYIALALSSRYLDVE